MSIPSLTGLLNLWKSLKFATEQKKTAIVGLCSHHGNIWTPFPYVFSLYREKKCASGAFVVHLKKCAYNKAEHFPYSTTLDYLYLPGDGLHEVFLYWYYPNTKLKTVDLQKSSRCILKNMYSKVINSAIALVPCNYTFFIWQKD